MFVGGYATRLVKKMHYGIGIFVWADNKKDAIEDAMEVLSSELIPRSSIDYGSALEVVPVVVNQEFQTASQKHIDELFGWYLNEIEYAFKELSKSISKLNKSKEKKIKNLILATNGKKQRRLWDELHYRCHEIGTYIGNPVRLYDHEGSGLTDMEMIYDTIDDYRCFNKDKNDQFYGRGGKHIQLHNLYLVRMDTHE